MDGPLSRFTKNIGGLAVVVFLNSNDRYGTKKSRKMSCCNNRRHAHRIGNM